MKASVIIPVYNTEKYLRACLDSVFAQTQDDFEVICVDDCSTDGSRAILEAYAALHPNMTVLKQEHALQGAARNRGIRAAQGDYLYFLDSDDQMKPELLEHCHATCEDLGLDFVTFDAESAFEPPFTPQDKGMPDRRDKVEGRAVQTGRRFWNRYFKLGCVYNPVLHFLKRNFVLENGLFFHEGIYYEDNDWAARLYLAARRMAYLPEQLYMRLYRQTSVTASEFGAPAIRGLFGEFDCALDILDAQSDEEGFLVGDDLVKIVDYLMDHLKEIEPSSAVEAELEDGLERIYESLAAQSRTEPSRMRQVAFAKRMAGYPVGEITTISQLLDRIQSLAQHEAGLPAAIERDYSGYPQAKCNVRDEQRAQDAGATPLPDSITEQPVRIALWGIGAMYRQHIDILLAMRAAGQVELVVAADNSLPPTTSIDGMPLVSPDELSEFEFDFLIVMNKYHSDEIFTEAMERCGIPREKLRTYELLMLPGLDLPKYKRLCNSNISIISDNCWGGIVCKTLQMKCCSPFKNVMFAGEDFLRIAADLPAYMAIDHPSYKGRRVPRRGLEYFAYELGDCELQLAHEYDPDIALEKWLRRRQYLNWDNLFGMMHTMNRQHEEAFNTLSGFKNKVCFVPYKTDLPSSMRLPVSKEHIMFADAVNDTAFGHDQTPTLDLVSLLLGEPVATCTDIEARSKAMQ